MGFEGFPYIIGWELTLACNLICAHCGSSAGKQRNKELTLDEALGLCDQFPPLLVQEVNFTGGEPLLYPHWPQIAERLRRLGIATKLITNGLLLSKEVVKRVKDVGITAVGISIDGPPEIHDRIRGQDGLYRQIMASIEQMRNVSIPVTVITTANDMNTHALPLLFETLCAAGVGRWQIQPIFPLGRARGASALRFADEQYLALGTFVRQLEAKGRDMGLDILPADSYGYYTEDDSRTPPWRGCPAGLCSCGVTSDGRVKGCLSLPDAITEGDLRKDDLWEIWFRQDAFAYTRSFSHAELGPFCGLCDRAEQCRGGCSAMSYGSTGKFHNDPYCFYGMHMRNKKTCQ